MYIYSSCEFILISLVVTIIACSSHLVDFMRWELSGSTVVFLWRAACKICSRHVLSYYSWKNQFLLT